MSKSNVDTSNALKSDANAIPFGMSAMQVKFVDEFLVDRNAIQAAIRAGYSARYAKSKSWELLRAPRVRDEVNRRVSQATAKADVSAAEVIAELKKIALFDVGQLFTCDGKIITDAGKLPDYVRRGLTGFDIITLDRTGRYIVKLTPGNKLKAIELLMKHLGLLTDRIESTELSSVVFSMDFGDDDVLSDVS